MEDFVVAKEEDYADPAISSIKPKSIILEEIMSSLPKKLPKKARDRIVYFLKLLNRDKVSMHALRSLSFFGIPEEVPAFRPLVWRMLFNYLPNAPADWITHMRDQQKVYESFRNELIIEPELSKEKESEFRQKTRVVDHPLSQDKESVWNKFHEDRDVWEEIEKDIKRTRNEIGFFTKPIIDWEYTEEEQD